MFRNNFSGFGHAGNDAASRKAGDKDVASVRLALSNGKDRDPTWVTVEAWGSLSARLATVKKGDKVGVTGRLAVESYKDKEGVERTTVKIVANDIAYLSPRQDGAEEEQDDPF